MRALQGQVEQKLVISDKGIEQYMQVKSQDAGQLIILPSPSIGGLYAQATANQRQTVQVLEVGKVKDITYGILLNDQGKQYGFPMSYEPRDLANTLQVIYVAQGGYFPRLRLNDSGKPDKRTIDVLVVGNQTISLYYAPFDPDANLDKLNKYQGFVVSTPGGIFKKGAYYKIWFELTGENLRQACENPNYNGIQDVIKANQFSLVIRADQFNPAKLESMLRKAEEAPKTFKITVRAGKQAEFRIPLGEYTLATLTEYLHSKDLRGRERKVADKLQAHVTANNPVMLNGKEFLKNQPLSFQPGMAYKIEIYQVASQAQVAKPVQYKPPVSEPKPLVTKPEQPKIATVVLEPPQKKPVEPTPVETVLEPDELEAQTVCEEEPEVKVFTDTKKPKEKRELVGAGTRPERERKVESYRKAAGGS